MQLALSYKISNIQETKECYNESNPILITERSECSLTCHMNGMHNNHRPHNRE